MRNRSDRPSDPRDPPLAEGLPGISVETGRERPTSGGISDRLILAVAVIALLGGAFIIGGKVVGDRLTARSSASPTVAPSLAASQLPTPSATQLAMDVVPGPLPSVPPQRPYFNGWVRALRDTPLYRQPNRSSPQRGVLKKGAIAYGYDSGDPSMLLQGAERWIQLQDDVGSFILASSGGSKFVELLRSANDAQDGYFEQIEAGPDRFVVVGSGPAASGVVSSEFLAVSTDGQSWVPMKPGTLRGRILSVTYGPAGWIAMTEISSPVTDIMALWGSDDALTWRPLGRLTDSSASGISYNAIRGSPAGYLLVANPERRNAPPTILWSADVLHWQKVSLPEAISSESIQVSGTPWGFYLQAIDYRDNGSSSIGASSIDGRTWRLDRNPPTGSLLQVAPTSMGMVGLSISPIGGEPRAWIGNLEGGILQWQRDDDGTTAMRGSVIPSLLSDGVAVLALGAARETQAPIALQRDGQSGLWHRDALPPGAFGGGLLYSGAGLPSAVGPTFLAIGTRPTLASLNPTIWIRSVDGRWSATRQQLLPYSPDPSPSGCPSRPHTALAFVLLNIGQAVSCFGGTPLTFRAWATICTDCTSSDSGYTPAWLADTNLQILTLSAVEAEGTGFPVVLAPNLAQDLRWNRHWLEVTGHLDDAAATSCRHEPDPQFGSFEPPALMVLDCRRRFVVTRVALVDGP